jgi:hypothetical protein
MTRDVRLRLARTDGSRWRGWLVAAVVAAMVPAILAACRPAPTPPIVDPLAPLEGTGTAQPLITDADALERALRDAGVALEARGEQPFAWFEQPARVFEIGKDALFIHVYPDADAAARDAERVGADGLTIARKDTAPIKVVWTGQPHLYLSGPLLVVYVGTDPKMMHALTLDLGPQFAGPVPPPGVGVR